MIRRDKTAALEGRSRTIRVLILADSAVSRAGLEAALRGDGRFAPIQNDLGTFKPGVRAMARTTAQADVVLLDAGNKPLASMPLSVAGDGPPLVLLIDDISRGELIRALHSGVRALLRHDWRPEELCAAVESVSMGLTVLGPDELDLLLPANRSESPEVMITEALTARESEVLALMSQGLANKIIADQLDVSEHTVKFHVSSILSKLGVASRTEAVTRGLRDGLIVI